MSDMTEPTNPMNADAQGDPLEIVWLASYPKSGNTWLRFFLTALMLGPQETSKPVIDFIPEVGSAFQKEAFGRSGLQFMKTHYVYGDHIPLLENTRGFIYIMRDPMDIMPSAYNYHLLKVGDELGTFEDKYREIFYSHFLAAGGANPQWVDLNYGTWHQHVSSWLQAGVANHPCLLLRYEDMKAAPLVAAHAVCAFLNIDRTQAQIDAALEWASFTNMKALETKEIERGEDSFFTRETFGHGKEKGHRFMKRGKSGLGQLDMRAKTFSSAREMWEAPRRQFGYTV